MVSSTKHCLHCIPGWYATLRDSFCCKLGKENNLGPIPKLILPDSFKNLQVNVGQILPRYSMIHSRRFIGMHAQ